MNQQSSKNLVIGSAAILSALGIVAVTFGVPLASAKYQEISKSTLNDVRQDAEIKHGNDKLTELSLAVSKIAENSANQLNATNEIKVSQARFEAKLDTWEPAK